MELEAVVGIDMLILLLLLLLFTNELLTIGLIIGLTVEAVAEVAAMAILPVAFVAAEVVFVTVVKESLPTVIGVKLADTLALNLGTDVMVGVVASPTSIGGGTSFMVVAVVLSLCLKGQPSFSFLQ